MFAFEKALVGHCSPTLSGLKPANLLSLSKADYPQLPVLIERYSQMLADKGISFCIICECGCRWLLLVYRRQMLWEQLSDPQVQALLKQAGYPVSQATPLEPLLRHRLLSAPRRELQAVRLLEGLRRCGICQKMLRSL